MKIGKLLETFQELFFDDKGSEKKKKKLRKALKNKMETMEKEIKKPQSEEEKGDIQEKILILQKLLKRLG